MEKERCVERSGEQTSSDLPTEVRDAFLDFFNISDVINQCT